MHSILHAAVPGRIAATRIVCLPGAYSGAADFVAAGFAAPVVARALPIDLEFLDVPLAHLTDESVRGTLQREIVQPARAGGCRCLWFAGISLGGLMALDYAAAHPGDLDGVLLIAPYLGNRILLGEISAAGGLGSWEAGPLAQSDAERRVWRFIRAQPPQSRLLHLGYGSADRFADAHRLLATALPATAVDVVPGGHDWDTWKTLWEIFLERRFT
jgi:pimeloyl-ACP methyl ester carboxylesterase